MIISDIVYFDGDKIELNKPSTIIYKGFLCDSAPECIYMHYGYGLLWENLSEIKLLKNINNHYEADITLIKDDIVYFCFRDSNGKWDNNYGQNYYVKPQFYEQTAMVPVNTKLDMLYPKLRKGYFIRKKIKITFYKVISFIGKLISGKILKRGLDV